MCGMRYKAVIFDIGGVLIRQPQIGIRLYEKQLGLPTGFLGQVFMKGAPDNSFCRLERGELVLTEFFNEFDAEVREAARDSHVQLQNFSPKALFTKMELQGENAIHKEMFSAVRNLKMNNIKTCALTNNWIDDRSPMKNTQSSFMIGLRHFFDVVIESAVEGIRKPDPKIYKMACERLNIHPTEAVFLDDIGRNLKSAAEIGITCIKVENPIEALKELQDLVGIQLGPQKKASQVFPPPIKPNEVPHAVATLRSGIKIHYVELGEGPPVLLFHGFPDLWYAWRYQIPALASAGYRVIAMDQRGYGDSSVPFKASDYCQEKLCRDAIDLMDFLGINQATVVGHDWGGSVVWNMAVFYPHRLSGVCGIATPLFTGEGLERLLADKQTFNYQVYFRQEGVAEKELEADLKRTFTFFFRSKNDSKIPYEENQKEPPSLRNVCERGGLFVGYPQVIPKSDMISEDDMSYYIQQYAKSGFRGPVNWYRNSGTNIRWESKYSNRKIAVPSLMITASDDFTLRPEFSIGMEERIHNLSRADIKDCGHWLLVENPDEVSSSLIEWLDKVHKRKSKL